MRIELKQVLCPQPKSKIKASDGKLEGKYKFFTSSPMQTRFIDEANYDKPSLIFGTGGNASVHFCDEPFSTSTDCLVMYGRNKIELESIYNYLKGNISLLEHGFKGAGLKHISKDYILAIEIELPSEAIQHEFLQKNRIVDEIIEAKRTQLLLSEDLVKSRFIEMFGMLNVNNKNWPQKSLGQACEQIKRYPTFCNMEYLQSGVRVIRIGNILLDGHLDTSDENYVFVYENANSDYPDTVIEENDIIMAVRGDGSAAKRIGIVTEPKLIGANISPNLIRIKAKKEMLVSLFLFYYLTGEVGQARLDAFVNKTAKKNIAAKDIVKVITPIPPIQLQREFAAFVEQVDKSKFYIIQMQILLRLLIRAIQQKTTEVLL